MNRFLNQKFQDFGANDPGNEAIDEEYYQKGSSVVTSKGISRNICFVTEEQKHVFLSYAYMIFAEFDPEENKIELEFTSHKVTLKGIKLEVLFYQLMDGIVRQIKINDSRYNELSEKSDPIVNSIKLDSNQ